MKSIKLSLEIIRALLPLLFTKQGLIIVFLIWFCSGVVGDFVQQFRAKPNIAISIEGDKDFCMGTVVKDYQDFKRGSKVQLNGEICYKGHRKGYLTYSENTGYRPIGTGWTNPLRNTELRAAGQIESIYPTHLYLSNGDRYPRPYWLGADCFGKQAFINTYGDIADCK